MAAHNDLGRWGEDLAAHYLQDKGYHILYRDWRYRHRDLDIIAMKDDVLVIVEVKTRSNEIFLDAERAVTPQKIRSITIAANTFVKIYQVHAEIRFDIITIVGTPGSAVDIRHTENAFLPFI